MRRKRNKKYIMRSAPVTKEYFHHSSFNLYINKSNIEDAGSGVFTHDEIPTDTIIDEYVGELYEINICPSRYFIEIEKGVGIDAFDFPRCYMAMVNDTYGTHEKINCEFVIDVKERRVFIKSIAAISPGEELYVSYGNQYWDSQK